MKTKNGWKKSTIIIFLLGCIGSIFYYSWIHNPGLETETYLPLWIRKWSNEYYNLRTAVPFVVLGFLLEVWQRLSTVSGSVNRSPFRLKTLIIITLVVCLAEGGQFFIATRQPDFMDVFFGISGGILGCFVYHLIQKINLLFSKNA
ncbi:VanZ family protein [Flavobacterium sp. AC]|uniref:VanZ family protein n=1 Tax=Flavobacterium azizsancarii TaxID=2961580 RepID=A0ABT4WFZ6_9FLAO|nr:VanZ family protein [Flavobacterium azizsancarii]MDA6071520.1 VanZ family protein [Flavobacterium azizsancarii]